MRVRCSATVSGYGSQDLDMMASDGRLYDFDPINKLRCLFAHQPPTSALCSCVSVACCCRRFSIGTRTPGRDAQDTLVGVSMYVVRVCVCVQRPQRQQHAAHLARLASMFDGARFLENTRPLCVRVCVSCIKPNTCKHMHTRTHARTYACSHARTRTRDTIFASF